MSLDGAVPDIDPVAPAPARTHPDLKPSVGVKLAYGAGQIPDSVMLAAAAFVFFYYTAVLKAPGSLVGAALFFGILVDATVDPLIGSISDNIRSRFGRRLPLMVVGTPLTALAIVLLFAPPAGLSPMALFAWLTISSVTVRTFVSIFHVPYIALGAEMASGYAERTSVVAYRTVIGILVTVAITALAYSVFFAGEGGLQRADGYPGFGWALGALILLGGAVCCLGVWRYAAELPQVAPMPGALHTRFLGELREVFRNRSFRLLFLSAVIFYAAQGLHATLNTHVYIFVWRLTPELIQFITYAYLLAFLAGVPFTPLLARRMEKKTVVLVGLTMVCLSQTVMATLRAAGLFTPTGAEALPWLMANVAFAGLGIAFAAVTYPSMMADAADEHEHLFGRRREGLYFAGLGFAGKGASGVGVLAAGFLLDLIRFPREQADQPGLVVAEDVLRRLTLSWGPAAALMSFVAVIVLMRYAISRARHAEIAAALRGTPESRPAAQPPASPAAQAASRPATVGTTR